MARGWVSFSSGFFVGGDFGKRGSYMASSLDSNAGITDAAQASLGSWRHGRSCNRTLSLSLLAAFLSFQPA